MERRFRMVWWTALVILVFWAAWKMFIIPGSGSGSASKPGLVASEERQLVVYVTGAVAKPGLVRLPLDARLDDALKEAEPLPEANLEQINPAQRLKDGQKISVPYKAGSAQGVPGTSGTSDMAGATGAAGINGSAGTAGASGSAASAGNVPIPADPASSTLININTAGPSELDKLPGIGPALAERIIQYRDEHGPFMQPEDLMDVSGIGPKTFEKMSSMVTVGP